ncbi:MAG: helix-turn-helix domain-containing protein [Actinomycetota bacterium]
MAKPGDPPPFTGGIREGVDVTISEAAEILGVHYMTVYRYIRTGRLQARKQGRDWRIAAEDLDRFLGSAYTGAGSVDWAERLHDRVVRYDASGAWLVVESALISGLDVSDVYTQLMAPVLGRLGSQWEEGLMTIAEEHAATNVCQKLIGRLGLLASQRGVSKGVVVIGCPEGEHHQLAATIASDLFVCHGYEVINSGVDVPLPAFVHLVANTPRLIAVGISATLTGNDDSVRHMIDAVRAEVPAVPIVLGGSSCHDPSLDGVNVDAVARSAIDGVALVDELRRRSR